MSKFCENCGAQLADQDKFCACCGAKPESNEKPAAESIAEQVSEPAAEPSLESIEQPASDEKNLYNTARSTDPIPFVSYSANSAATSDPVFSENADPENEVNLTPAKKSGKGTLIVILIIILALLIAAGVLIYFIFFSSGDCKEAIEAYYETQEDYEFDDFREATGDTALTAIVEKENASDIKTFKLGCQRMQRIYRENKLDYDFEYQIVDMQPMSNDELTEYNNGSLVAKDGYIADIDYTVKDESTGEKENHSQTLTVVKYDRDWCVTDISDDISYVIAIGGLSDDEFDTVLDYYAEL